MCVCAGASERALFREIERDNEFAELLQAAAARAVLDIHPMQELSSLVGRPTPAQELLHGEPAIDGEDLVETFLQDFLELSRHPAPSRLARLMSVRQHDEEVPELRNLVEAVAEGKLAKVLGQLVKVAADLAVEVTVVIHEQPDGG